MRGLLVRNVLHNIIGVLLLLHITVTFLTGDARLRQRRRGRLPVIEHSIVMCARVPFLIVALNLIEEGLRRSIGSLLDPRIPRNFEP